MKRNILFGLIILFGCSHNSENVSMNSVNQVETNMKELNMSEFNLDTITEIKLPLHIDCGINENSQFSEFNLPTLLNEDVFVVGRINQNVNSKITVLLTYFRSEIKYPFYYSINSTGQIIDSIPLHNGNCAADPWIRETCWSVIKPNMEVEMFDSIEYFTYDGENQTLDSIRTIKEKVIMNSKGYFNKKTNSK